VLDIFASFHNKQLPEYFSWRPDPTSRGTDAFDQGWPKEKSYAFPPFSMINKVLRRVKSEEITLILIAPFWPQQGWFSLLLELLYDTPCYMRGEYIHCYGKVKYHYWHGQSQEFRHGNKLI
jgi:hypothetical protein